jgi:hypothetical protein
MILRSVHSCARRLTAISVKSSLARLRNGLLVCESYSYSQSTERHKKVLNEIRFTCRSLTFSSFEIVNVKLNLNVGLSLKDLSIQITAYKKESNES